MQANNGYIFLYNGKELTFGAAHWCNIKQFNSPAPPRPDGLAYTAAKPIRKLSCLVSIHIHSMTIGSGKRNCRMTFTRW